MAETRSRVAPGMHLVEVNPAARAFVLAVLFAALTALGAQMSVRLPFTPVPLTLQVFFVLLSGAALGSRLGALSQAQYLALGAAGLPVFAGGASGIGAFGGPTTGYLIGFVLAAWLVGFLSERMCSPSAGKLFLVMMAGVAAIHLPGALWLSMWLNAVRGSAPTAALLQAAVLGVAPFLGVDTAKAALAAAASARLHRSIH